LGREARERQGQGKKEEGERGKGRRKREGKGDNPPLQFLAMPLGTTRDPCSILKGTIWEPNGQFARLSQRDPVGSPLTKTGGIPTGIPCGPREASQMGPFRVPIGMSGWDG